MRSSPPARLTLALLLLSTAARAGPLTFEGKVPEDEGRFFDLPFIVPPGVVELQIRHANLTPGNILDWGLEDPNGFRGWGGGNTEDAVVGLNAASRSYLPGPLPPGTWKVVVGKAKLVQQPARYRVEVTLRTTPTLSPQTWRRPYQPAPPLKAGSGWYAGDFHVHSLESGDARPPLDELAAFARGRGLDFVHLSDHNTTAQLDFIPDAQARHPDVLLIPGVEFTTYGGHANGIGATRWVDARIGYRGQTIEAAVQSFASQGAIFSINHPAVELGNICIGCAWKHPLPPNGVGGVEIATGGWFQGGFLFDPRAIAFWDWLCSQGVHAAALGGSDDHRAGVSLGWSQSPIGSPTTMVWAHGLSTPAILEGVRSGRTVVKLQGPDDPMVEVTATGNRRGDTVAGSSSHLSARVTGGRGDRVRWVKNGVPQPPVDITADPFVAEFDAAAPGQGEDRWRAEVLVAGWPRTVTSHVWLAKSFDPYRAPGTSLVPPNLAYDFASGARWIAGALLLGTLIAVGWRRRSRRRPDRV